MVAPIGWSDVGVYDVASGECVARSLISVRAAGVAPVAGGWLVATPHCVRRLGGGGDVTEFGAYGAGAGQFNHPRAVCVTTGAEGSGSHVIVREEYNGGRLQVFKIGTH
jgi:hypothetical protein